MRAGAVWNACTGDRVNRTTVGAVVGALALVGIGLAVWLTASPPVGPTEPAPIPAAPAPRVVPAFTNPVGYQQPPIAEDRDRYDFATLDASLERMMVESKLPGVSMIVLRDGKVLYDRSIGNVDGTTAFTIGSASKWQSAAAIMSLVEDGILSLDDPASKYVRAMNVNPIKGAITVRQALSHQAGMSVKHTCLRDYQRPLSHCVAQIANSPLVTMPGSKFGYGSVSYHLAARVAEVAAGESWREIYQGRIAKPLGLTNTRFGRVGQSENPGIAGNLNTSRDGYARFLEMIRNYGEIDGVRVLSEASVREMERGQVPVGLPRIGHVPARHLRTKHSLYGLGVWRDSQDAEGNLTVSSSPGKFGFTPWVDRRLGVVGVLSTEYDVDTVEDEDKPDPSRVIYLICNIIDQTDRGPQPQPNKRCVRGRARAQGAPSSPAPGAAPK